MKKILVSLLLTATVFAQTINPNQIRPATTNGQVLTTPVANQPPSWQTISGTTATGTAPITVNGVSGTPENGPFTIACDNACQSELVMQVIPPVSGQYVILYPTILGSSCTGLADCVGTQVSIPAYCSGGGSGTVSAGGYSLPSYVNPANVTAVYAFAFSDNLPLSSQNPGCPGPISANNFNADINAAATGAMTTGLAPASGGDPWIFQLTTALFNVTGANIPSTSIIMSGATSVPFVGGSEMDMVTAGLIVYYTGSAPPTSTAINIIPPLDFTDNTLRINPSARFPGQYLIPDTIANQLFLAYGSPSGSLFWINNGASSSDCTTGGGTSKVLCIWDGSSALTPYTVAAGSSAFNAITSGTNTTATMTVGSGASIVPTGTGAIQATNIASTIAAGTNVTITGAGTVASPYSITSTSTGATAFSALTGSTNTTAAMVVGTGASIAPTGSGAITATVAPAAGLTGSTLASGVTASSLTSVGTIATGVWAGTTIAANHGGSGVANTATHTLGTSNQNWATLGTGIVKNTTTTGAISDAASSDVTSLFSGTCSSSTFLRGDGACATPSGAGTVTTTGSPTTNTLALFSASTSITNSHIDDGGTTASTITITEPVNINAGGASWSQIGVNVFSALPTCNSGQEGTSSPVSDSTTATWGATVTGGSTNHVLAYCDGTSWTVMGK